jgi:hypothetical protein
MTDHSCGHADFGPFVSVSASASRNFTAASPNVNSVHTHYTIALPGTPGSNEGTVKYRPQRGGEWAMYVAPTTSLTLLDATGNAVPLVMQQSIRSCALLNHAYVFNLTALATYRLVLGPSANAQAAVVIEKLDDFQTFYFADADGDGFGDSGDVAVTMCEAPEGRVTDDTDCDDGNAAVNLTAAEICDGVDNDCDGEIDEGLGSSATTCGVGACRREGTRSCVSGSLPDDCSPGTPAASDSSCNAADDDCDGQTDEDFVRSPTACGIGACQGAGILSCVGGVVVDSCNAGSTGAETCDGEDNDCNGEIDDVPGGCRASACGNGLVDTEDREECDDGNAEPGDGCSECKLECLDVPPAATSHTCGHVEYGPFQSVAAQAYPGFVFTDISVTHAHFTIGLPPGSDSATAAVIYYPTVSGPFAFYTDTDEPLRLVRASDGAIVPMRLEHAVEGCLFDPESLTRVRVFELDETEQYYVVMGPTPRTEMVVLAEYLPSFGQAYFTRDRDGDGWGDDDSAVDVWCELENNPYIHSDLGGDCDPVSPSVNPGATEVCNDIDDNCQGGVDDVVYGYRDADGDGYGDWNDSFSGCTLAEGYVVNPNDVTFDCDDTKPAVHTGAQEICDELDNDCDGSIDEGLTCTGCVPAPEICDGVDNDCDGETDEEGAADPRAFYRDADGDGHGSDSVSVIDCDAPDGFVSSGGDCNDADAAVHPAAEEPCNGIDDDCDGRVDEGGVCQCRPLSDGSAGVRRLRGNAGAGTAELENLSCRSRDWDCR